MRKLFFSLTTAIFVFTVAFAPADLRTITGKIINEKAEPIPYASVIETGTKNAVSSDSSGNFSIQVSENANSLTVSAIGYDTKTINIGGKRNLDIVLTSNDKTLQEVVVTAASVIKRKAKQVGYSTTTITSNNLFGSSSPSVNLNQTLSGKAAGLTISQTSGSYSQSRIVLRGARSISANNRISKRGLGKIIRNDTSINNSDNESYERIVENPFLKTTNNPLSTFSIDVDAASYSNVRRFINMGQVPPSGAIRTEEMINYFHYQYPQPAGDDPFSINTEISDCPWNKNNRLLLIGLQGRNVPIHNLPPSNLVFLIDVSGSMQDPLKLPLVQSSMKLLVDQLREEDRVAMVVYAGNAGLVLPSASGKEKNKIKEAIDRLNAGGSTAGGAGIQLAYKIARENFMQQSNNRVILCTDGDFNVGLSSDDEMERLIEKERESGIFLTVLGYGMGNYQDSKMQKLADKGNGNHAYIDGMGEAKKVLVNEFGGTLFTIAKDVKLQLEFNPAKVQGYRLIGYENRILAKEDFNNDKKDAGELGSGHTVTALYEIIPFGVKSVFTDKVDDLKYQKNEMKLSAAAAGNEMVTVKFRYKAPDGDKSKLIEHAVTDTQKQLKATSDNFRFAASVAQFAMLLRNSEFKAEATYTGVLEMASKAKGADTEGYRSEFIKLVEAAKSFDKSKETVKLEKKRSE
jgi:Ca-activated chloride channel family protein